MVNGQKYIYVEDMKMMFWALKSSLNIVLWKREK